MSTTLRTRALLALTGLLTIGGIVALPASASASTCSAYAFNPGRLDMDQDGIRVTVDDGVALSGSAHFNDRRSRVTSGHAIGWINGRDIDITMIWDRGPGAGSWGRYTGRVDASGNASGTVTNSARARSTWRAFSTLRCVRWGG